MYFCLTLGNDSRSLIEFLRILFRIRLFPCAPSEAIKRSRMGNRAVRRIVRTLLHLLDMLRFNPLNARIFSVYR